ncbi:MAG: helicase C-terminal domain-containing protein, partial [Chitinophagaceae bacterium]
EEVKKMKGRKETAPVVFVNRYDGIDLPDDACRVLILDSKPISESLADLYEESCRSNSDIINIKTAQKIEQGLGRSVRGEKDYSAIILVGADLVNFIKGTRTRNLFSSQTQKQIEIGFEISRLATEELTYNSDTLKEFASLVNQCLGRDEGWKGFYSDEMESLGPNEHRTALIDILKLEREAEYKFFKRDYEGAVRTVQKIIDKIDEPSEKGWYLQIMARYQYKISKVESNRIQKGAFLKNHALLNPVDGVSYDKLSYINEDRISRIKDYVREFPDYSELFLEVNHNCSNISYTSQAEVFEESLKTIGKMLGFLSQRPDKEFKRGPDNLWCCGDNEYILFECKNEVDEKRTEISKTEAAQLNTSIAWFEQEYTSGRVLPMMVIHTKNLAKNASLESKAKIMRKESLYALRRNIKNFYKEFKDYEIHNVSDKNISEFLTAHKLDIPSLKKTYCEDYYHKKV